MHSTHPQSKLTQDAGIRQLQNRSGIPSTAVLSSDVGPMSRGSKSAASALHRRPRRFDTNASVSML